MDKSSKEPSFEEALSELESITRRLESGQDSLEDSMKLYESGIKLKSLCEQKLREAEGKWQVLRKSEGEISTEDLDTHENEGK